VPDLSWGEVLLRVAVAAALGGAIGVEREIREREAGLRTHLLVSVGAALFTLVSAYGFSDFRYSQRTGITLDPTRISAQIVSGIGFLGAGAIIRQGLSIRGLTTAATLWAVAAIGLAAGAGYYSAAVLTTALVLFSLWPLRLVAHKLFTRWRPAGGRLEVELSSGRSVVPLLAAVEDAGVRLESLELGEREGRRTASLEVDLPQGAVPAGVVARLGELDEVRAVRWSE
jgi:putative Mg2+ transporter-C (MgtC) family protein